jgi:hypothetical protein
MFEWPSTYCKRLMSTSFLCLGKAVPEGMRVNGFTYQLCLLVSDGPNLLHVIWDLGIEVRFFPILHINIVNVLRQRMLVVLPIDSTSSAQG